MYRRAKRKRKRKVPRLRVPVRFANRDSPLGMTENWDDTDKRG